MYRKTNKIKKTIRLEAELLEAVEAYRAFNNLDFTGAVEALLFKGLENQNSIKDFEKRLSSIEKTQREQANRLAKIDLVLLRFLGKIYGHTKQIVKGKIGLENEDIKALEQHGIGYAIKHLTDIKEV